MKVKDNVCGKTLSTAQIYATIEHDGMIHCFCSRACWLRFADSHGVRRPLARV